MKRILQIFIAKLISIAKNNKLIQSIFEAPIDLNKFKIVDHFLNKDGEEFKVYDGLRDKIRPGWQNALKLKESTINNSLKPEKLAENGRLQYLRIENLIDVFLGEIENKTVLEIGCHYGQTCFAIAEKYNSNVWGSEFFGYKSKSTGNNKSDVLDKDKKYLEILRNQIGERFKIKGNVTFKEDDICDTKLPFSYFDLIFSFDVLEHLSEPEKAFSSMKEILKPGGILIHEYNPFFCFNGGHSLCTLDIPWGHTRLDEEDYIKYLEKYRPEEKELALSFYRDGINRMSQQDLKNISENSGLELVDIINYSKEQHVKMLNSRILNDTKKIYNNISLIDLVSPRVKVILRKKA